MSNITVRMETPAVNGRANGTSEPQSGPVEVQVPMPWGYITGRWWGPRDKQPIIAMHGWQDNAGTWDNFGELLPPDMAVYAIDMPGHGLSSPYPPGMQYYIFWDGIAIIRRIVKHFEWEKITLMGHSMGGALSFMYAAIFPDDVDRYISVDIAGPPVRVLDKFIEKNGLAIDTFLKYERLSEESLPCYEYEDMLTIVHDAYKGSVTREACKVLMKRGMAPAPKHLHKNGFHFQRDLRLKVATLGMFSLDAVLEYAKQNKCKVLNIRAKSGMEWDDRTYYQSVIDALKTNSSEVVYMEVQGTHHVHLNEPEKIIDAVLEFLKKE